MRGQQLQLRRLRLRDLDRHRRRLLLVRRACLRRTWWRLTLLALLVERRTARSLRRSIEVSHRISKQARQHDSQSSSSFLRVSSSAPVSSTAFCLPPTPVCSPLTVLRWSHSGSAFCLRFSSASARSRARLAASTAGSDEVRSTWSAGAAWAPPVAMAMSEEGRREVLPFSPVDEGGACRQVEPCSTIQLVTSSLSEKHQ